MSQESGTPGFLAPSPSETNLQHPNKRSKISYTREFLFSLANIDTAVKLPREVQLSFSGLFADAPGLLAPPLSVPDYGCHKIVLQNSSVLDNANHLLHRSNEPYRPPCCHRALPPSRRDGNDLINSHTPGSYESTNQEKGEEKRWRKDTTRLPKDDIWYSQEYVEALLMSPTATSLNTLQPTSNVINQQSVQGAVRGDVVQPSILPETTNGCSAQHQQGKDFTNETVGHPKGTPRVLEPLQNCRNIQKNLCDVEYELQLSKTAVCVYGSPQRITKSDVSDLEGSVSPPPVEDEKQSIPRADKCESAPAHCEGILSLQGVKEAVSVSMKLNSTSHGFQIQHDLESNSSSNSLDGKSNSSFELRLPDEDSLTSYDGPFFMPDVENSSVVDNSISSPGTNPIEADVFCPSSPRDMIEKLVESILSDENCPAPHLDDFIAHHGAGLEGHGQSSYTQLCSNHSNLGRDEQSHTSFQRNSMDSPIHSSATCHPFSSNTCQPFSFFHDGLRRFHDQLKRFDHKVGQTMFQQMINPGKLPLRSLCALQGGMTPHLPLQMDSYTQMLNSMRSGTLGYQVMGPNPGSRSNGNINQAVLDSLVDMNLRARQWHPYVGGF